MGQIYKQANFERLAELLVRRWPPRLTEPTDNLIEAVVRAKYLVGHNKHGNKLLSEVCHLMEEKLCAS